MPVGWPQLLATLEFQTCLSLFLMCLCRSDSGWLGLVRSETCILQPDLGGRRRLSKHFKGVGTSKNFASYRQSALQTMYRRMEERIENLTEQVAGQARQRCGARLLMTHPGVGRVTALATDAFQGDPQQFTDGKAPASYVGHDSARILQRLGALTNKAVHCCAFSLVRPVRASQWERK